MCGWPTFEFCKGKGLAATVTYLYSGCVRWDDGPWGSDTYLTDAGAQFLDDWLRTHGATEKQCKARQRADSRPGERA
jgi:hypothetical protein